jgi:hypothetical protein
VPIAGLATSSQSQEAVLALHAREVLKLRRIIALAEKLIDESPKPKRGRPALSNGNGSAKGRATGKRIRRTGKDLVRFRKMLKAERKRGAGVAELARKHGISPAYIYLLA